MLGILLTWDCDSASKSKELKEMHILSSQTKSKELIPNDDHVNIIMLFAWTFDII